MLNYAKQNMSRIKLPSPASKVPQVLKKLMSRGGGGGTSVHFFPERHLCRKSYNAIG